MIVEKVKDFILKNSLIEKGDNILLSVSPGKDSMAMIEILDCLKENLQFTFSLFHLNHKMRGEESDNDENFLIEFSNRKNIQFFNETFSFKEIPSGKSFEEYAREIRYNFLENILKENIFNKIATAHNKNDNYETVLMRIFQGTGIHGLKGIPVKRNNIIRPILILSINEIYSFLKENNLSWREDSSNKDSVYLRNYIRNEISPVINKIFHRAVDSIFELSNLAKENSDLINNLIVENGKPIYELKDDSVYIKYNSVNDEYLLMKHKITEALRNEFNFNISIPIIREIFRNLNTEKSNKTVYKKDKLLIEKILYNNESFLKISKNKNFIIDKWSYSYKINEMPFKGYIKEIDLSFNMKISDYNEFSEKKLDNIYIFVTIPDEIEQIYIRNRLDGDRILIENGSKKIKDLLIEKKLDNESKERVPFLIIDKKLAAFMPGFQFNMENRVAKEFKIVNNNYRIICIEKV